MEYNRLRGITWSTTLQKHPIANYGSVAMFCFILVMLFSFPVMIFIFLHILLNVINLYHKLPILVIAHLTQMICCTLAAILLLIGSAIPFSKYTDWKVHAASVLGLIAMGLFFLEALYHLIQHKRGKGPQRQEQPKDQTVADTEQTPSY